MSTTATLHLPVDELLFGGGVGRAATRERMDRLAPQVVDVRLAGFPGTVLSDVREEVGALIDGVLEMDAVDVLRLGWRKHRVLSASAQRTLDEPGRRERVELATHTVTVRHRPSIELLVNGAPQRAIHFEIRLDAKVVGLEGVVERGRLTAIAAGDVVLSAGLLCEGIELARADRVVDLDGELTLGDGIPLVRADRD